LVVIGANQVPLIYAALCYDSQKLRNSDLAGFQHTPCKLWQILFILFANLGKNPWRTFCVSQHSEETNFWGEQHITKSTSIWNWIFFVVKFCYKQGKSSKKNYPTPINQQQ
jgi:hypothetical protein